MAHTSSALRTLAALLLLATSVAAGATEFGTVTCPGDGSGTTCPCGNDSPVGQGAGCLHSFGLGGKLRAHFQYGQAGTSRLWLEVTQVPDSSVLYFQGDARQAGGAGVAFGDGLRCVGGTLVRLGVEPSSGGMSLFPGPGDKPLAVAGVPARHFQAWYRNAAAFCTPHGWNLTNAVTVPYVDPCSLGGCQG